MLFIRLLLNGIGYDAIALPAITVDSLNRPHVVWLHSFTGNDSVVYYSTKNGETWTEAQEVTREFANFAYIPRIAVDNSGVVHVVWHDADSRTVKYQRRDGGSWSAPTLLGGGGDPDIVTDSVGNVHVAWGAGGVSEVYYSRWDGSTWSALTNVSNNPSYGDGEPVLAVDTNNNLHLVWVSTEGGGHIFYKTWDRNSWSQSPTSISSSGSGRPAIAVDGNNGLHVVWRQDTSAGGNIFYSTFSQPPTILPAIDYFALGDSIASGHGLLADTTPCHRSQRAYPYQVYAALKKRYTTVNLHHLACSGATVTKPSAQILQQDKYKWFDNQVKEVESQITRLPTDHPILVSITIGANDFGWTDLSILPRLVTSASKFQAWADKTTASVASGLKNKVSNLLSHPNVAVVITEYDNPMNTASVFFIHAPGRPCGDILGTLTCYERTEYVVHSVNNAFVLDVWIPLGRPERLRVTRGIHDNFHGREAPQSVLSVMCGDNPPPVTDTWIQYPGDPNSNGEVPGWMTLLTGYVFGDCIHPNQAGAMEFARGVNEAAIGIGR